MSSNYTPTTWVDGQAPAVDAANLNHLEQGVAAVDAAAVAALAAEVVRAEAAEGANATAIAANVTALAAKYTKPGSGIPSSDLAAAVQTLLTSAGTAVQPTRLVNGHALSADVAVSAADVGLGNVNNTSDANKPLSSAATTALAAKADLVSGKVPSSQLPAIAIDQGAITVANAAARYALVIGSTVEPGQPVVQASTGQTFVLAAGATDPSQSGSWLELAAVGKVQSVNGYTGAVALAASDVGAATTAAAAAAQATANAAKPKFAAPVAKSAAFTAAAATPYLVDISGGSYAATLPSASAAGAGAEVVIKVSAASATPGANALSITPAGSDTINGGASALPLRLVDQAKVLVSDGVSNWVPLSGDLSLTALAAYFGLSFAPVGRNVVIQHGPPTVAGNYPVGTFVLDADDSMHAYEITA